MYELDNETFSYEELVKAAEDKGYTIDELFAKNPNLKKVEDTAGKSTSQGQGAPVAGTAAPEIQLTDTASLSASGSLESQKTKVKTANPNGLNKDGKLYRTEDIIEYEESYKTFQKNRDSELRAITLKNNNIDIAAPAINENVLKAKINQSLGSKEIKSRSLKDKEYQDIFYNVFKSDTYLSQDLPLDIMKTYSKEINAKQKLIEKKYDLTSQEQVDEANAEFTTFQNNLIKAGLKTNKTYIDRVNNYRNALGAVLEDRKIEYDRKSLGLDEDTFSFVEGFQKGARQIGLSVKKSFDAAEGESLQEDISEYNRIQNLEDGETISYGGRFIPNVGWSGTETGTKKDALDFYNKKITAKKANLLNNIKENVSEEELQRAFKSANLEDGISFSDVSLLVGEQALQLPLAYFTNGVGVFAQEFGNSYFDNIDAYLDKNNLEKTPENMLAAVEAGEGDVAIAAVVGGINSALEKVGADQVANGIFGKTGKTAIKSLINDGFKKYVTSQAAKQGATQVAKGGFVEFLTESFQTATSQLGKGVSVDDTFGYIDTNEIKQAAKAGGIVGTILPFGGKAIKATVRETSNAAKLVAAKFNPEATSNYLDLAVKEIKKSNVLNAPEKEQQLEAIAEIRNANVKIPSFITGDSKKQALDLIIEKQTLEKSILDADPNLVIEQKERIEAINIEIRDVVIKSKVKELGKKDIARAEEIKEKLTDLNLTIEAAATTEDLISNLIENHTNDNGKPYTREEAAAKAKNYGFISQKEDGTQTIFINEEIAFDSGVTTTAQHEVLHAILKKYASNAKNLGVELNDFLEETFEKEIENSQYSKSFKEYTKKYNADGIKLRNAFKNKEITEEKYNEKAAQLDNALWEETMPLLSEAITNNELSEKSTIWEKLKDIFNKIFNTSNIKGLELNEGKDVYNLVKNYNKIYKSGRGIGTLKNVVSGETKGKLITKEEKATDSSKLSLANNVPQTQINASKKAQELYEKVVINEAIPEINRNNAKADIVALFEPSVDRIVNKYRNRPGFNQNKDLLRDDLLTGAGGVLDMVNKYDLKINDSLGAYINTYLERRGITISDNLLGKNEASTFKSDVAEAKDIMATETAEDAVKASEEIAKEKPAKKKTLLSEKIIFNDIMNKAMNTALIKGIALNVKKFDIATGKNRTVTPFIGDLKKDLADFLEKDVVSFIKGFGLDNFLIENRETILDNYTTTFLSKHPFFRKGILKRVNGEWVAPTKIGPYKYDWVDAKGNKLKIDRDNAAGRGMTSGPEFIKRNPKIKEIIKENEFVDYHFQDGAQRGKIKTNAISSLARQLASEISFETLKEDLKNGGDLTNTIRERAGLNEIINLDDKLNDLKQDLDRGLIKFKLKLPELNSIPETVHAKLIEEWPNFVVSLYENGLNVKLAFNEVYPLGTLGIKENKRNLVINEFQGYIKTIWLDEKNLTLLDVQEKLNNSIYELSPAWRGISRQIKAIPYDISVKNEKALKLTKKELINIFKSNNVSNNYTKVVFIIQNLSRGFSHGRGSSMFDGNNTIKNELIIPLVGLKFFNDNFELINGKFKYKENNERVKSPEASYKATDAVYNKLINSNGKDWSGVNSQAKNGVNSRAEEMDNSAKNAQIAFWRFIEDVKTNYEKGNLSAESAAMLINSLYSDQKALIKKMYYFKGIYVSKNKTKEDLHIYEHNPPVSSLARHALAYVTGDLNFEILNDIVSKAAAHIVPKSMDDAINKNGNKETWDASKGIAARIDIEGYDLVTNPINQKGKSAPSLAMNTTFNEMIERKKGFLSTETVSQATAKLTGAKKGKLKVFIPASADDFVGLLYNFLGTGKQGDADMKFFENKLLRPLARANSQLNSERQGIKQGYHNLVKANKGISKKLRAESDYKYYSNDAAVRVYMWNKLGYEIPGISETDKIALIKSVESNPALLKFADELITVPKKTESWLEPEDDWTANTVESDLQDILSKIGRARIFEEFITNADIVFSKENMNKVEAAYGPDLRSALDDMLYRIKKGRAREVGGNKMANAYLNWVRGSVATTMFFNTRSALLQQLSIVNFTNWEDNNVFAQGKFIAGSPKEYAEYWVKIFNSDWMKERRQGLKTDINESELVAKLEGSKNKNKALLSYILEKGFSLTKYGDNIAIATGGAPFLYNREKKYIKEGMTESKAKEEAFLDFQEIAERTQQSSRQDLLSNQQVSVIGRIFLAFQNTTMQMTRLQKKAILDIINRRGSFKANISRLVYYGAIQNTIFSYMQSALFVGLFGDDEDEELKMDDKTVRAVNTILDSALRGSGIAGAALATLKNAIITWKKEDDKGFMGDNSKVILELLNISPAVGIKARKINTAMNAYKFNKKILDDISYTNPNNPYYGIAGSLTSAAFNIPLDRIVSKAANLQAMTQQDAEAWQRTALFLGYNTWDLGMKDPEIEAAKNKKKGFKSEFKSEFKDEFKDEFK